MRPIALYRCHSLRSKFQFFPQIYTNLFHNRPPAKSSDHHWQLFITDALTGNGHDGTGSACDFLQNVYETTKNRDGSGCGEGSRGKCRQGDLGGKFGKVRVGRRESMFTKVRFSKFLSKRAAKRLRERGFVIFRQSQILFGITTRSIKIVKPLDHVKSETLQFERVKFIHRISLAK